MEITKTKPMYVGVDEVCADWGVSRSKGYAIIKQLSDQMKAENPKLLTMAGKINRCYYEEACIVPDLMNCHTTAFTGCR